MLDGARASHLFGSRFRVNVGHITKAYMIFAQKSIAIAGLLRNTGLAMQKQTNLIEQSGRELLQAFQEDLEERPARKTAADRKAARVANQEYEAWRKGGK